MIIGSRLPLLSSQTIRACDQCASESFPSNIPITRCESCSLPSTSTRTHAIFSERILATNRDEFLGRPTEHARFRRSFKDHVETTGHAEPDIVCGLDLQAGGTWLGLNKTSGCVTFLYVDHIHCTRTLRDLLGAGRISRNPSARMISQGDT